MPDPLPTFLTLPVEIRLQIYAEVFSPWFKHTPPLGNYPLGITSICQQTHNDSFPLILMEPRLPEPVGIGVGRGVEQST
jgi:hypothetical protein